MKARLVAVLALTVLAAACSDTKTVSEPGTAPTDDGIPSSAAARSGELDIVATALENGSFTTLAAALQTTGLDAVLADPDSTFTVFAPTDEAFAQLGDETIDALLNDTDTLSDVLLYHVVPDAAVDAATAFSLAGSSVTTANGDDVAISRERARLFINTSEVIIPDVGASNGIIHAVDTVLMPPVDMEEMMNPATPDAPTLNIIETAVAAGGFETLVAAVQATGLDATLSDPDTLFTVFAPTDDAFAELGEDTIAALLDDTATLADILSYHVIAGQAVDAAMVVSLAGGDVSTASGDTVSLSLRDGELFVNESRVILTDIVATNGIIHVIDTVLTPPADTAEVAPPAPEQPVREVPEGTILDVAREAGFSTLVAAAGVAGLDSPLDHPLDFYTVFAPTDEAFAALGQDTIDALLADPATLEDVLRYHILPGNVIESVGIRDILGFDIQTGNGDFIQFGERDGSFFVNDSRIIAADVPAVNGVIHAIDRVLIPPMH